MKVILKDDASIQGIFIPKGEREVPEWTVEILKNAGKLVEKKKQKESKKETKTSTKKKSKTTFKRSKKSKSNK